MKHETRIRLITHLGNDAAELWAILRERQQVADGTANGVNII